MGNIEDPEANRGERQRRKLKWTAELGHRSRQAGNGFRSRCCMETLFSGKRNREKWEKIKGRESGNAMSGIVCFLSARQPPVGHGLLILEVSRSHTTHHSR